jgi:CheY-like chemotaxis protein
MARVLIVEDHEDSARCLARLLAFGGHVCTRAADGRQALAALLQETPDVVLLDLHMPVMDGVSFLRVLRGGHAAWQSLPVVLLTAADGAAIAEAARYGVSRVFRKGAFELPDLLAAVAETSAEGEPDRTPTG